MLLDVDIVCVRMLMLLCRCVVVSLCCCLVVYAASLIGCAIVLLCCEVCVDVLCVLMWLWVCLAGPRLCLTVFGCVVVDLKCLFVE